MRHLCDVRHIFLDMDGTIYHGGRLYPTTLPFLRFLAEREIGHTFLSNNSSCSTKQYGEKLHAMGIDASPEEFYISTDYTIDFLKRNHPEIRRIFLLGMACIRPAFEAAGFQLDESAPEAVIVAFDRELVYERLCRAAWFLKQGIPGFATHPDPFCPTDQPTWLPDCGALTACLETATGVRLKVLGKPDPGMLRAAAARRHVRWSPPTAPLPWRGTGWPPTLRSASPPEPSPARSPVPARISLPPQEFIPITGSTTWGSSSSSGRRRSDSFAADPPARERNTQSERPSFSAVAAAPVPVMSPGRLTFGTSSRPRSFHLR